MKLSQAIIFAFATGFLLIGIHQSMKYGVAESYWLFMLSIGLLFWYKFRKDEIKKGKKK